MILFAATAFALAGGGWVLLRAPARPEVAPAAPDPDGACGDAPAPEADAGPATEGDGAWDDFLPPIAPGRPSPRTPAPDEPEADEPEAFDMGALAARLRAEEAGATGLPPDVLRIDGFDAEAEELEIPLPPGALGAVTTRRHADGLAVLVDGEAVALLAGCASLDPSRIRVLAS